MSNLKITRRTLAVLCLLALTDAGWSQEHLRKGLVQTRPAQGPFVETEHGFMIPYQETIPGTDISFEMVPIPGGRFLLGSPPTEADRSEAEGPQVSVMMEPFWMGKHEVTWSEYHAFMELVGSFKAFERRRIRPITEERELDVVSAPSVVYDMRILYAEGDAPDSPAVTMTHFAAKQYTKWLSLLLTDFYRLPSEAEWEYACRAGSTTAYSFGDDPAELAEYAWFVDNSDEQRHRVGTKRPNAWGLHDMHGNVAEWVLDRYSEEGYQGIGNGMVEPLNAIQWPSETYPCTVRGGHWDLPAESLRSASRMASSDEFSIDDPNFPQSPWWHTSFPSTAVGFRILRPLTQPDDKQERDRYWNASNEEFLEGLESTIEDSGHGSRGLVDPDLPNAIRRLEQADR